MSIDWAKPVRQVVSHFPVMVDDDHLVILAKGHFVEE